MPVESLGAGMPAAPDTPTDGVVLEGLDGGTPLGILAALGAQRVLADRAAASGEPPPRLSWRLLEAWRPVLHGPPSVEAVVEAVFDDAVVWKHAPILAFRYLKVEKGGPKPVGGLRAPVAVLRAWLANRRRAGDGVSLAYASALMCETATEAVKEPATREQLAHHGIEASADAPLDRIVLPTSFDFLSRNAQFLEQVEAIRAHLSPILVEAGLTRGLPDPDARSMDWDPGADTPGAIYTGYSRGFLPAAEWLAFRGLVCLPVTGAGGTLVTTACSGRRKDGAFVWPLWDGPVGPETARAIMAYPRLDALDAAARAALGVSAVWRADLTKKADGYAGVFSPARPV
jgi:hypothetical protein